MKSTKGFALLEIILASAVVLALAFIVLKQRRQETVQFKKVMQDNGVQVAPGAQADDAKGLEKAIESQLKATSEQQEKDLEKAIDPSH